MARAVGVWVPLEEAPEGFVQQLRMSPTRWLPDPADDRGPGHYGVQLTSGPITRMATVGVGQPEGDDRALRCRLVWKVDHEPGEDDVPEDARTRSLPSFEGELALLPRDERRADLRLEGTYEAPTGAVGRMMNPAQIQGMAETLLQAFLSDIAGKLTDD